MHRLEQEMLAHNIVNVDDRYVYIPTRLDGVDRLFVGVLPACSIVQVCLEGSGVVVCCRIRVHRDGYSRGSNRCHCKVDRCVKT